MIETLRIEHLAVVDEAELELGPGLNVLTGETGAGKSIVLGAIGLLAGARASSDSIRSGAGEAVVEAIFRTEGLTDLEAELEQRGLSPEDHELVVRRTLSATGRSRARVAGELVPVGLLSELFGGRLEISSQHSSQALRQPEQQARLVDAAGATSGLRAELNTVFGRVRELERALGEVRSAAEERARRRDFLAFQVAEIDEVGLKPGEVEELEQKHRRLASAERLREAAHGASEALASEASSGAVISAAEALGAARRLLEEAATLDPELAPQLERLHGAEAEVRDLALDLDRYGDGLDADPGFLAQLDDRLSQVERLRRKYGASGDEILAERERIAHELLEIEGADSRITELEAERATRIQELEALARKLSAGRRKTARTLSRDISKRLADLAMAGARVEVELEAAALEAGLPCGPHGSETPRFVFASAAAEPLRPLHRVASGGELSRVFLALKSALRSAHAGLVMVMVFDEVDAGIGGAVADRVGKMLVELAGRHQILCITHLPQIAALADRHFRVHKRTRKGRSQARVERIEGADRVDEIARMAGGEAVGEETRRHAEALLGRRSTKRRPTS